MSQQNHHKSAENEDDNCSFGDGDFVQVEQPARAALNVPEERQNGNANYFANELTLKVVTLEANVQVLQAKNQMLETTIKYHDLKFKHLEEKLIQERNYAELEAKMGSIKLTQKTELRNPPQNHWNPSNTKAEISENGFKASNNTDKRNHVYAEKGFAISDEEHSPSTAAAAAEVTVYYFEVKHIASAEKGYYYVGLSNGSITDEKHFIFTPNSYAISSGTSDFCWLSGGGYDLKWSQGAVKPVCNCPGDVIGCGILMDPRMNLSIFFTKNGILMAKHIPIASSLDILYPTISMTNVSLEANFGENPDKPFKFDIQKCQGMVVEETNPNSFIGGSPLPRSLNFENAPTLKANFGDNPAKPFAYDIRNCQRMGLDGI